MKTKTIYLLRHGETDFNKQGRVQGRGVNASLNDTGRRQAQEAANYFSKINIDKFYASSLKRTHETLIPFNQPFEQLSGFDEISWGKFEGIVASPDQKGKYKQTILNWRKGILDESVGEGETPGQVMERQQRDMKVVINDGLDNVLICMHGRAIRIMLCWLLNYPLNYMDGFPHQNCAFYGLKYKDGLFSVHMFNHRRHLSD